MAGETVRAGAGPGRIVPGPRRSPSRCPSAKRGRGLALVCLAWLAGAGCRGNEEAERAPVAPHHRAGQPAGQEADQQVAPGAPGALPSLAPLPGAEPPKPELAARIRQALASDRVTSRLQAPGGVRTRHRTPEGMPRYSNRLILEPSPYLQQHAHNPVDWYPWGQEAFAAARRLNRPVLLSVGYAACHWCHLMSDESFDDLEIAEYINRHYIAIKVDREERPDVDEVYLAAAQITSGHGAWPTTVWLTADGKPFFGTTYVAPRAQPRAQASAPGLPGLLDLLQRMAQKHANQREEVERSAEQLLGAVRRVLDPGDPVAFTRQDAVAVMDSAAGAFEEHFDPDHGGVRGTPKHPATLPVRFLLRQHRRTGEHAFLRMATRTLEAMAAGGLHDQVGGGFHHYAVDQGWRVPHFEKLLFDNALLVVTYLEAYQVTGREDFARVARDVLRFLERELREPGGLHGGLHGGLYDGLYYAGLDADSMGHGAAGFEEGAFYTWHEDELARALAPVPAALARELFGVSGREALFQGKHVLFQARPVAAAAAALGMAEDQAQAMLPGIREALHRVRARRPRPQRDEKITTDGNALMITAQVRAAQVLGDPSYLAGARQAAATLVSSDRLSHVLAGGRGEGRAFLTDHAMLIAALLDLFEATGHLPWLEQAIALARTMDERYADRERGGYYFTSAEAGADADASADVDSQARGLAIDSLLSLRQKPNYDGTLPSGNSVAALALLRLHAITGARAYLDRAEALFASVAPVVLEDPARMSDLLLALDFWTDDAKQIVLLLPAAGAGRLAVDCASCTAHPGWRFRELLRRRFEPNAVVIPVPAGEAGQALSEVIPLVRGKAAANGRTSGYVCERGACARPTQDVDELGGQLDRVAPLP